MFRVFAIATTCFLFGCASSPRAIEKASIVNAVVTNPRPTGWYRNWCSSGELVNYLPGSSDCIIQGGEIFKVKLKNPRDLTGQSLGRHITVGFPAHALIPEYRRETYLFLQPAASDFQKKTGISYLATDYGNYNPTNRCVVERGTAHTSRASCPDKSFHEKNKAKCVPLAEFMAHYAEGT